MGAWTWAMWAALLRCGCEDGIAPRRTGRQVWRTDTCRHRVVELVDPYGLVCQGCGVKMRFSPQLDSLQTNELPYSRPR